MVSAATRLGHVEPRERAGAQTGRKYEYQYERTARAALDLLSDGTKHVCVYCDWHDDYVVETGDPPTRYVFHQVKGRKSSQGAWTFGDFFGVRMKKKAKPVVKKPPVVSDDAIVPRMLTHYRNFGDNCAGIAFVTNAGLNPELSGFLAAIAACADVASLPPEARIAFDHVARAYAATTPPLVSSPGDLFAWLRSLVVHTDQGQLESADAALLEIAAVVTELSEIDLPHIQRAFVWSEEQIARLFDSILREYPISTLLIWKTKSPIRMRRFIDEFRPEYRQNLLPFFTTPDESRKSLVLDGQQRLQSLFIGLSGSYAGRELYFHVLSGDVAAPDDVRYRFQFLDKSKAAFPWVKFKDIVFSAKDPFTFVNEMVQGVGPIADEDRARIFRNIGQVFKTFHSDEGIGYQELDSIENPTLYTEDDVVEVFIRANSGGTKLGKSDLLFSLLAAGWDGATEELESLLESLNAHGFEFTRDFVLKTCLSVFDQGARYEVPKFRQPAIRSKIEERWDEVSAAMQEVLDFVRGSTFIKCDKALPSYNVLIPLIYLRYHYPKQFRTAKGIDQYLIRASLAGAFSGQPDQLIDQLTANIKKNGGFDLQEAFGVIRSEGRSLELTESRLWQLGYGSDTVHLLFNLWYRDVDSTYTPSYPNNLPQVDHVFPQSVLRKVKAKNPSTGRMDVLRYREGERNQLANCMLLTAQENGAGGKSDTPPDQWFKDKAPEYLAKHLIPQDPALWQLDKFDEFLEARKALILKKMRELKLVSSETGPLAPAVPDESTLSGAFTSIPPAE